MTQAERDRLVALKNAKKKLITQKQAAEEIGVTERQVRRLLRKLRRKGDRAVIHELRGRASNRKLLFEMEQRAMAVLADPVYRRFGPTVAAEYLHQRQQITVSKETVRQWMAKAELWRAGRRRMVEIHEQRPPAESLGGTGAVGHLRLFWFCLLAGHELLRVFHVHSCRWWLRRVVDNRCECSTRHRTIGHEPHGDTRRNRQGCAFG